MELFDVNNTEVQLTMVIKLHQLQRESLPTLTYRNLEDYLSQNLWRKKLPRSLHEAVNDVMAVQASEIVRFLAQQAVAEGNQEQLGNFTDLIGGK